MIQTTVERSVTTQVTTQTTLQVEISENIEPSSSKKGTAHEEIPAKLRSDIPHVIITHPIKVILATGLSFLEAFANSHFDHPLSPIGSFTGMCLTCVLLYILTKPQPTK